MLHGLRGRLSLALRFLLLLVPREAGACQLLFSPAFSCSPPVLMPQDRPGVSPANFRMILCGLALPGGGLTPAGPGLTGSLVRC
jgi:hypothetical protein